MAECPNSLTAPPRHGDDERVRAQLAAIVEHSEDAIVAFDRDGHVTAWNRSAEVLYGYAAAEVLGRRNFLLPPDRIAEYDEALAAVLAGEPVLRYETQRLRKDGALIDVAVTLSPIRDREGALIGASSISRDISAKLGDERRRNELLAAEKRARVAAERSQRKLAEAQERFRIAFEHAPHGIALISVAPAGMGSFLEVNPALSQKLGYSDHELLGRRLSDFLHPDDSGLVSEMLGALLDGTTGEAPLEVRGLRGDGAEVRMEIRASLVRSQDGRPLYSVAHFRDVTAARRHEEELRFLADHDPLTGLVNRRRFEQQLDELLASVRHDGRPGAVLVVDLDNFKGVNDTYGHAVGDDLLRRVAAALQGRVRAGDLVARLGGDEFGILLPDAAADDARVVAGELLRAVEAEAWAPTGTGRVRVTASVGINCVDPAHPMTAEALLIDADVAMYQAKQTGRNRLEVAGGDERGDGHHQWSKRVQEALSNDGLELWEQPLMNLATGDCDRSELLVRMRGRHGEVIPAAHFVPVIERLGQMQAIDSWVVSRALALLAHRQGAGSDAGIEINLSARSVTDERIMDRICTQVAAAPLDPTRITLEVTETAAIGDVERARRLMGRLARLGCRFALDDFGAGFASLRHLKHLPFDVVKIDGEFIGRLPDSHFDQLAVRGLVEIAHGSGKLVIAERVADDATLDLLRAFGVDYAQGFHIARPRPTDSAHGLELAA